MREITRAKAQRQGYPEQGKGFRVAQGLGTWDVTMGGMRLQGRLEPHGGPKCKGGEESGLFCRQWGAGSGF